jgi:hypothetical protein
MNFNQSQFSHIEPSERILLLPHCLRRSENCKAKYTKRGLECVGCTPTCPINVLRNAALRLGYKGVCVAPGGSLALNYIREMKPKAIVAVACQKELLEGIDAVKELSGNGDSDPPVVVVPLLRDGCIDTEVDEKKALEMLSLGCSEEAEAETRREVHVGESG